MVEAFQMVICESRLSISNKIVRLWAGTVERNVFDPARL